jgi:hypothetical protein
LIPLWAASCPAISESDMVKGRRARPKARGDVLWPGEEDSGEIGQFVG